MEPVTKVVGAVGGILLITGAGYTIHYEVNKPSDKS